MADSSPDSLGRHDGQSPFPGYPSGYLTIRYGVTVGNGEQQLPYPLTEIAAAQQQGRGERGYLSRKIEVEPMARLVKDGQVIPFLLPDVIGLGGLFHFVKP